MPENLASRFSNLIFFKVELIATKKKQYINSSFVFGIILVKHDFFKKF